MDVLSRSVLENASLTDAHPCGKYFCVTYPIEGVCLQPTQIAFRQSETLSAFTRGFRRSTRVFALMITQKRVKFRGGQNLNLPPPPFCEYVLVSIPQFFRRIFIQLSQK